MACCFLRAPPQQQASLVVRRQAGALRISFNCSKCHRWLLAGDSSTAALPAATEIATCSNVQSMNRFACLTLSASRPCRVCKPLGRASVRRGFGPCLRPGTCSDFHGSTERRAVHCPDCCIALLHLGGNRPLDLQVKQVMILVDQPVIGPTFQPHHASAYATGAFSPENTSSAEGGLSTADSLVPLLAAGSAEAGASQRWSFAACLAPHTRPPLRTLLR